jgi:hypothetical protein
MQFANRLMKFELHRSTPANGSGRQTRRTGRNGLRNSARDRPHDTAVPADPAGATVASLSKERGRNVARSRAAAASASVAVVQSDMRDFVLGPRL